MMKKIVSIFLICIVICAFCASCAHDGLEGTWGYESENGSVSFTFTSDGKLTVKTELDGSTDKAEMTYTEKDGVLVMIDGDTKQEVEFAIKDGKLTLDGSVVLEKK